jgi:hypothetical protein
MQVKKRDSGGGVGRGKLDFTVRNSNNNNSSSSSSINNNSNSNNNSSTSSSNNSSSSRSMNKPDTTKKTVASEPPTEQAWISTNDRKDNRRGLKFVGGKVQPTQLSSTNNRYKKSRQTHLSFSVKSQNSS